VSYWAGIAFLPLLLSLLIVMLQINNFLVYLDLKTWIIVVASQPGVQFTIINCKSKLRSMSNSTGSQGIQDQ